MSEITQVHSIDEEFLRIKHILSFQEVEYTADQNVKTLTVKIN